MKVAIVHYWLVSMRGGEKVLEALLDIFPDADVYTHVLDREQLSEKINNKNIHTTFIGKMPLAKKYYQWYLPLMPYALEELDLTRYDLIISSESGPAKGIIPGPNSLHLCYTHSPMRYIWDHYYLYKTGKSKFMSMLFSYMAHALRVWDVTTSARVDGFIANSNHVKNRIQKYYNRDATIIHPPVEVERFYTEDSGSSCKGDYYIWIGQLVSYKRPDVAIDAFNINGKKLIVIGDGEELELLKKRASANIEFLGRVGDNKLATLLTNAKALIFPGEEDFGITPVESLAAGCPVIALNRGGVKDSILDGVNGILYDNCSPHSLMAAIDRFETSEVSNRPRDKIRESARRFNKERFVTEFIHYLKGWGVELDDLKA